MNYRVDIQALRGIAVLLVVFYHARALPLEGGYLGVDIFFVISGFLITTQIARQVTQGSFSFRQFYLRRAWRLLPAAYTVLLICCLCAPFLLSALELADFREQLLGALTFTANIVLWTQAGYFEEAAELKPLLHTWSLSIEEQYYLVMPALLYFIGRNKWLLIVASLSIVSFAITSLQITTMPGAVFYLTPTRIWELGIGSILALALLHKRVSFPGWAGIIALLLMLAISVRLLPFAEHTEINILVVTLCTALIIASKPGWLNTGLVPVMLAKVGTISYSLYLVHWPIFAFMNSVHIGAGGVWWPYRAVALLASFALSWALYEFIEMRFRILGRDHSRTFFPLVMASLILFAVAVTATYGYRKVDYEHQFRINFGLSDKCNTEDFSILDECRTNSDPRAFLWGDSFAMHLGPGLKQTAPNGITQAAKATCPPIPGISIYAPPDYPLKWAEGCMAFNRAALEYALENKSIELIVLAAQWAYLLDDQPLAQSNDKTIIIKPLSSTEIATRITNLTDHLQRAGKKVVVVSTPPTAGFDIAKCHERHESKQISFGGTPDCNFTINEAVDHQHKTFSLMQSLREKNVAVFSFNEFLCSSGVCQTKLEDAILYRDHAHLSYAGSELIARRFNIFEKMEEISTLTPHQ